MPSSASTSTLADYLATGYWRDEGGFPHKFDTSHGAVSVNLTALTKSGQALARAALDAWEMVADIAFREVTGRADIAFDDARRGATASVSMTTAGETVGAKINIGASWLSTYGSGLGSYSLQSYIHEIGHALGLGHAGLYDSSASYRSHAKFANDSWQQTVMSYFNQVENTDVHASYATAVTPMLADVMAIQKLYGAAKGGPTAGDTTYGVGANTGTYLDAVFGGRDGSLAKNALTIWDRSGTDTIDFGNDAKAQAVNLAAGAVSSVYGLKGNLGIAAGTTIENYVAGSGNDSVKGNEAANKISGGAGHDKLDGAGGRDRLSGGDGADKLYGGDGSDRLYGGAGTDRLLGGRGNDQQHGGTGRDTLKGEAGSDSLRGEDGNDVLDGGANDDALRGGRGNDGLYAGRGDDWLSGERGNDRLGGGSGADAFVFNGGQDVVIDFQDDVDALHLDDRLWGGRSLSLDRVLDFAHVRDGDVVLDFGNGDTLRIDGLSSIDALRDDLVIV